MSSEGRQRQPMKVLRPVARGNKVFFLAGFNFGICSYFITFSISVFIRLANNSTLKQKLCSFKTGATLSLKSSQDLVRMCSSRLLVVGGKSKNIENWSRGSYWTCYHKRFHWAPKFIIGTIIFYGLSYLWAVKVAAKIYHNLVTMFVIFSTGALFQSSFDCLTW
ncbi:unnamed protein product [Vicia faba]|uniref:Uncharacterized protein n=1 Tax=Vicia faba TaxID=3906 RepID=A0AAV0ZYF1_VICFA|nr:unnamed protein product [Vicia faba]